MRFATPDPAAVSQALAVAGVSCRASELELERREEKWLVRLPDARLAWLAASPRGLELLGTERRVLRLLAARCSFAAPRILFESDDGELDVRTMVSGSTDPWLAFERVRDSREHAVRTGAAIGALLAEQHSKIGATDAASWLPQRPAWPEPREWIRERLPSVVNDSELIARAESVLDIYDDVAVDEADRALVHTDVGFHNLAIDAESFTVNGIFDYEGAAWADRHHDFRYLVLDFDRYEMLEAASAAYEPIVGRPIRRDRVVLYNAACAITFLAYRFGISPEQRWCGRTLVEDLRWSTDVIDRVLGP